MPDRSTSKITDSKPELWFSTPIWTHQVSDHASINKDLLALMRLLEADNESLIKSNIGGWQSHRQLHQHEEVTHLRQAIGLGCISCAKTLAFDFENFELAITSMWLNRSGHGNLHKAHIHANTMLSGVYYVQTPPDCGKIEFFDPVTARVATKHPSTEHRRINTSTAQYNPKEGMLVIFPSWLQHWVEPNQGEGERVSVSFNVAYQPIVHAEDLKYESPSE